VNKRQKREAIERYLQKWQRILCLEDWQGQIKYEKTQPPDRPDLAMHVTREAPYHWASFGVLPHTFELHPDTVDQNCLHEWLHVIAAPLEDEICELFGFDSEVRRRLMHRLEETIDRMAVALWKSVEKVDAED